MSKTEAERLVALTVTIVTAISLPSADTANGPRDLLGCRFKTIWGDGYGEGDSVWWAVVDGFVRGYHEAVRLAREDRSPELREAFGNRAMAMCAAWVAAGQEGEPCK